MRVNRFVLDANIWISYFITNTYGNLYRIVSDNKLSIFYCNELIMELERVLNYDHLKKYTVNIKQSIQLLEQLATEFELTYPIKSYIPGDENDNYIIALALQTNAGYVTSGDKHILSEKKNLETRFKKLRILTKAEFEKIFAKKTGLH